MDPRSGEHTSCRRPFPSTWVVVRRKYALPAALITIVALAVIPLVGPHLVHAFQQMIGGLGA
jgi:hypothetical protein